jgi:hypothetical protein
MKKISVLLIFTFCFSVFQVKADEGMWLPIFIKRLNYEDMQKKGLKLTAEEIYSVNNSSLKDAIVSLGGFCTGEMISNQGLMLTNHHCGYDAIQQFSTIENDYLADGFWAMTKGEEKNVPGLTATFLVRMEDVSKEINRLNNKKGLSDYDKSTFIEEYKTEMIEKATKGTHYTAYIKSFFYGKEHYMFVNETFNDVRLVGAPPESVGKYGGDTDNWMWPRHTGDFCMFRVYSDGDGKPADFSADNVPFKPRHHLPVSIKGVEEGDFAMIMGYPGSTDRYLSSFGVRQAIEKHGPTVVEIRDLKLKTMKKDMDESQEIRIKYASKYAQTSNYWKYYIGQTEQLQTNKVYDRKLKLEKEFSTWVSKDEARNKKYGKALDYIKDYYSMSDEFEVGDVYALEAGLTGPEVFLFAYRTKRMISSLRSSTDKLQKAIDNAIDDKEKKELEDKLVETRAGIIAQIKSYGEGHFKDYNKKTDQKLVTNLLGLYKEKVVATQQPQFLRPMKVADLNKYSKKMFCKSHFASEKKFNKLLKN